MYEDENNLYHYSYRKGDEQNPNAPIDTKNYAEDPWDKNPSGGSPKKKGGSGLSGKIVALALVCALVGGFIGAGVSGATTKVNKTSVQVSDREVAQVQTVKVDGKTQMSMSEVYASNVNSVVSINVSATDQLLRPDRGDRGERHGLFHHAGRLHPHEPPRHLRCEQREGNALQR